MPSQQQEMLEMISNLKRALRREKEPPSSEPIYGTSNRGNKLKRGASRVHLGSLANTNGPEPYKQGIEHAGYNRYILERKPIRYNDGGEELSNYDSDEEPDAYTTEADPYEGIRIEELLRPITHPSELATHPTLSLPYLDSALPDMVKTAEENLRQERANLWRAKALNRQLLGDEPWIPCETVESLDDWDLFEPRSAAVESASKRRKLASEPQEDGAENMSVDHIGGTLNGVDGELAVKALSNSEVTAEETARDPEDVEMVEAPTIERFSPKPSPQEDQEVNGDVQASIEREKDDPETNGINDSEATIQADDQLPDTQLADREEPKDPEGEASAAKTDQEANSEEDDGEESSPAPPTRRITRALAAGGNNGNSAPPMSPLSPSPVPTASDSSLLQVDPIFLLPPPIYATNRLSALCGLPPDEALETRKLLTAYIQKQEECVRGLELAAAKLITALQMRRDVWEMCKAERHVGEMSDGEDWIDTEAWGLKEGELRKGRFEEEDIQEEREAIGGGRKGKRRRREQN